MTIRFISHNVQGFNFPNKRKKAFIQYKKLNAKIILLQETHFMKDNHPTFFHKAYNQSFYTLSPNKTKGVAFFYPSIISFRCTTGLQRSTVDILLSGLRSGRELTIANVYAPNDAQTTFFTQFFHTLQRYHSPHIILGGDFNSVLQPNLDCSKRKQSSKSFSKTTSRYINEMQLIDSWRALNIWGMRIHLLFTPP